MKRITNENFYKADELFSYFVKPNLQTGEEQKITESHLIELIDKLDLNEHIVPDIKEMLEVSKALFAYGYLYWSFLTLSLDQAFKAFEATVAHVHEKVYGSNYSEGNRVTLSAMIDRLSKRRIIDTEQKYKFHNIRKFRNMQAHPSFQAQLGLPSYDVLKNLCTEINSLFLILHNRSLSE
ncbi:DUF4145 domain-containing protein [Paenibacillus sp. FSL H8-0317]|uniref:DUF4145 domain-containing protein n=1 Tax=Paenibacillus TaxID=44249 RepID=UPI0003E27333|nr:MULTISPECIES: DUF4145 domain-containing protein [Paenibacillus]ETT31421.1 hypothetical protein C161_25665 [Paenibacillus sp. FSL R5-192]OMF46447.1 hypothetical protein BK136_07435 [Paenibacillus amylolyticus]PKQ91024.1 hypothetical protein CXK86_13465 [Paenibacillus sp. BGI2013]